MKFKQIKNKKIQKMLNILFIFLFLCYFCFIGFYSVKVHKRVELKTDIISKVQHARYGGSSRAKYDEYYLSEKEYYISLGYALFPSIRIFMERKKSHLKDKVSYYVDRKQIEMYKDRKIKKYTSIGMAIGENCPKNCWYYFTLLSYVQKYSNFFFVLIPLFFLFIAFYRPETPIEKLFFIFIIIFYLLDILVF